MANWQKIFDFIVLFAVTAWALGCFVTLPMSIDALNSLNSKINKTYVGKAGAEVIVSALEGDNLKCKVEFDNDVGNLKRGQGAKTGKTDQSCVKCNDVIDLVNDVFYVKEAGEMVFGTKYAGQLYDNIEKLANWSSPDCDGYYDVVAVDSQNNSVSDKTLDRLRGQLSNDINRIGNLFTEIYVLDKTLLLLVLSTIFFFVGILLVFISEVQRRRNVVIFDGHVMHWLYTASVFISLFTFIIAFCMSLTREFWAQTYTTAGLTMSHDFDNTGDPQQRHIEAPVFETYDQSFIGSFETVMVVALVFQVLSFAAHFTLKYGPIVQNMKRILEQANVKTNFAKDSTETKGTSANKSMYASKTAAKIQYAPLVSVARA